MHLENNISNDIMPVVDFRLGVAEAIKTVAIRDKILVEDLADILAPIVHTGTIDQVDSVVLCVGTYALNIVKSYAREAIRARDAIAIIDPGAVGIMRPGGVYFETSRGRYVYRDGGLHRD